MSIDRNNRPASKPKKNHTDRINPRDNMLHGLYIGRVISNIDKQRMGRLSVEILDSLSPSVLPQENIERVPTVYTVLMVVQGGGTTDVERATSNQQFSTSQTSSGMLPQAPPMGTKVLVGFIPNQREGFYLGSLLDQDRNFSIPGLPSAQINEDGTVGPSSELNPNSRDRQRGLRAPHPMLANLIEAGLDFDFLRGLTTHGMRRDQEVNMAGLMSKRGHTLVMDDGAVGTNNETDNAIRIRTAAGHQILMSDEANTIYINNANGSAWIEIDAAGHIDVYSQSQISMHAEDSINMHAGTSFNVEAEDVNIKSRSGGIKMEAAGSAIDLHAAQDLRLTSNGNGDIRVANGNLKVTAKRLDLNGPPAAVAHKAALINHPKNSSVTTSITDRVPEHEPWMSRDTFAAPHNGGDDAQGANRNVSRAQRVTEPFEGGGTISNPDIPDFLAPLTPRVGGGSERDQGADDPGSSGSNFEQFDGYTGENGRLDESNLTSIGRGHKLRSDAATAYLSMASAAANDGISWTITDSYRTYEVQVRLAQEKGLYSQGGLAATPGTSKHGWGLAVDLGGGANNNGTPQNNWLRQNAQRFGFYTIPREPWHWEFRG